MESRSSDGGRAKKGEWKRNRGSWVRSEEAKASDWTWNIPENPPIPKGESAGVAGPASGAMEVDSKRELEPETETPGMLTVVAAEAVQQRSKNQSDEIPARELSEQSDPWIALSFTLREPEESERQLLCPSEVPPTTSLSRPMASQLQTPRTPLETKEVSRDGTLNFVTPGGPPVVFFHRRTYSDEDSFGTGLPTFGWW